MGNTNADVIRAEFANDAAVIGGILAGQAGYSLTSPYNEIHKEKGGTSRKYASNDGDREITGQVMVTKTTEQLRLRYDASNYATFVVSATGNLAVAASSGNITTTSKLTITNAATQLQLAYNAAVASTLSTDSAGNLVLTPKAGCNVAIAKDLYIGLGTDGDWHGYVGYEDASVDLFSIGQTLHLKCNRLLKLEATAASGYGIQMYGKDYAGNAYNHASSGHTKYLTIDENGNVLVGAQAT